MSTRQFYYIAPLLFMMISALTIHAQNRTPLLERTLTIKATDQRLDKVLDIISETAGFTFSYSNEVINTKKLVTVMAENRTVKQILDQLFKGEISYQQIGNHLVLQRIPKTKSTPINSTTVKMKYDFLLNGYIRDAYSGEGINNASVYHEQLLYSSLSGDFGYYTLKFTSPETLHPIRFSRDGYRDTTVQLNFNQSGASEYNISLTPLTVPVKSDSTFIMPTDTTESAVLPVVPADTIVRKKALIKVNLNPILDWLTTTRQAIRGKNIKDTLNRKSQVTLFPPISTNRGLSSVVNNDLSFNILAGYNGGVNHFEIGGFANVIRNDVNGVQIAGFTNIVGRHTNGAQFAGFTNVNGGNTNGAQFAGFLNANGGNTEGVQFAGFANVSNGYTQGAQFAGFTNVTRQAKGLQAAGFVNVAGPRSSVTQFAGFANVAGTVSGVQGSGFANVAGTVSGVQAAGFVNVADTVKGVQIGFINVARHSTGISIGFLSFIKNGYHQLDFGINELQYGALAFRSGTRSFYTILHAGTKAASLFGTNTKSLWYYGYGIGTAAKLSSKLDLNLDLTYQHMNRGGYTNYTNEVIKFNPTINYKPSKTVSIYAGPSLNLLIADTHNPDYVSYYSGIRNSYITDKTDMGYAYKGWIGFNAGIRFF